MEIIHVILTVGLYPELSDDFKQYTKKFETFKNTVTSGKIDRTREAMIKHVADILSTPYNPKNPDTKMPTKAPRDMVWIKMIIGRKVSEYPVSYFHIVWTYSLVHFRMTQGEI